MKMNDEKELPVSQEIAWQALNDTSLLRMCIPGCESIELKDDGDYELRITAAIGPVKAKFKGLMRMANVIAPTSYTLDFSGQGGSVGNGRGEAQVVLSSTGPNTTLLCYSVTASVSGKLAQIGARLIDMAAQKMAGEFFDTFLAELTKRYAPVGQVAVTPASVQEDEVDREGAPAVQTVGEIRERSAAGSAGFWAGIVSWFVRLFRRRLA